MGIHLAFALGIMSHIFHSFQASNDTIDKRINDVLHQFSETSAADAERGGGGGGGGGRGPKSIFTIDGIIGCEH